MKRILPKMRSVVSFASMSVFSLASSLAYAQNTEENKDMEAKKDIEVIVVTGFRSSLAQGRDLKRNAVGFQDSIVAEDIADFPDLNLAESLQRISGVTITRDNGEGRQIALRGLGADFTRTQLNGMEALATNASVLDSRGSVSRTRSFDFNIFASELFNRVDVYKSYAAKQDEGGIAGTVNLHTPKPFDYNGFKGALSVKATYNDISEKFNPRIAALVSNTWGNFGATFSIAHSKTDSIEFGHRNWWWDPLNDAQNGGRVDATSFGADITAADRERLSNGTLAYARANTISSVPNSQDRTGVTLALQWRPSDRLSLFADVLYSKLESDAREYNAATLAGDGGFGINEFEIRGTSVVYAERTNITVRNEAKFNQSETAFNQFIFGADAKLADNLVVKASLGYSESEFDAPVHDKVYLFTTGRTTSFDYRNGPSGINTYDFDITDPSEYQLLRADAREDFISNEFLTFNADFTYIINEFNNFEFGLQYKEYESSGYERRENVRVASDARIADLTYGSGVLGPFDAESVRPFAVGDVQAAFPTILAANLIADSGREFTRDLTALSDRPGTAYTVTEETTAAYMQYNVRVANIRANFGVRYAATDIVSAGSVSATGIATGQMISIPNSYSEILPAFNASIDLTDELLFRFSANRNLSRPSLNHLRAASDVNVACPCIAAGNPDLEPFVATSFEAALEYYFGDTNINYVALSAFSKDMASFIVSETSTVKYSETGLPLSLLIPGQDPDTAFQFNKPFNGAGTTLTGIEIAAQYEFGAGFGVIANLTYANAKVEYSINKETVSNDLVGLSEISYNATVYYETERWGARISQAYRDEYLEGSGGGLNAFAGADSSTFVDASIFYNLSDALKLSLEAINLTNEKVPQYADATDRRSLTVYESGTNYLFGLSYRF